MIGGFITAGLTPIKVLARAIGPSLTVDGKPNGPPLVGRLQDPFLELHDATSTVAYTMIGDTTNFASRLESLNKYLSTQVLISDSVKEQLGDKFITRRLGEFRVAGKTKSVLIHELLCRCEAQTGEQTWIEMFEAGLDVFRAGDFSSASDLMSRTRQLRGGSDGPAEFYLRKIATLREQDHLTNWNGVIELSEK